MFSEEDRRLIASKGMTEQEVLNQHQTFEKGIPSIRLHKPAVVGDGIMVCDDPQQKKYLDRYASYRDSISKFVPASGSASRMFRSLFEFRSHLAKSEKVTYKMIAEKRNIWQFFEQIEDFAFFPELDSFFQKQEGFSILEAKARGEYIKIISSLLNADAMNYGGLPKGLLKFHRYGEELRTAAHEQLVEGLAYATKEGVLNTHFTVSKAHSDLFKAQLIQLTNDIHLPQIVITYSIQKPNTDTIAVTESNDFFRMPSGELLFRPAGHGALLENLNERKENLLFIKNIDNVVIDPLKEKTIRYKKILAGILLHYQQKTHELLRARTEGTIHAEKARELLQEMGTKGAISNDEVFEKLNRPIRVCGMVKNQGEPGGGPFWIPQGNGYSLQIVEQAQIDQSSETQEKIFSQSTHFSPVDIVCGVYDYKGEKFNLLNFRNPNTGFITKKSMGGKTLKALELPGLWNGSMADWNSVFVEVPLITFNPVKTINDLLRPEHQSKKVITKGTE